MGLLSDTNGNISATENVPLSYGSGNVWEWCGFLPSVGMTSEGVGMTGVWVEGGVGGSGFRPAPE